MLIAMKRGNHDMRGLVFAELDDEIGEIGFIRRDTGGLERGIQTNIVGSHGLHLDDFSCFLGADKIYDDAVGFIGVARPMDDAAGTGTSGFELLQVEIQMAENVFLDFVAGLAQLLPVFYFLDYPGAFVANDVGRTADILANLRVGDQLFCGDRKVRRRSGFADSNAHETSPASVEARISARWRQRIPVR